MGAIVITIIILVGAGLLYVGVTTGVLWTLLGGLLTLVGNGLWELLKLIGNGIGALFGAILSGIASGPLSVLKAVGAGLLALLQAIWLPALIIGLVIFICLMIWKAFFK